MSSPIARIAAGFSMLRPRTMTQLQKSLADSRREIRDLHATIAALGASVTTLNGEVTGLTASVREQEAELTRVRFNEAQLRAVVQRDRELEGREADLGAAMADPSLQAHIASAIGAATLRCDPFPYLVVDRLLPDALYDALIEGLPPAALFADRPANKQQLKVPLNFAPRFSLRIWSFMADRVVYSMIRPAVMDKFRAPLEAWLCDHFPAAASSVPDLVSSDGRLLLRTRGYRIRPHRDPKWGFITCILYLARPGDDERWGTDLYSVEDDHEARGVEPYWIDEARCQRRDTVSFRRNRALIFLNSGGAHGAEIPADAEPADLQRLIYQFRLGPSTAQIATLMDSLPPDRREFWKGRLESS
jgi:hypothetical protein